MEVHYYFCSATSYWYHENIQKFHLHEHISISRFYISEFILILEWMFIVSWKFMFTFSEFTHSCLKIFVFFHTFENWCWIITWSYYDSKTLLLTKNFLHYKRHSSFIKMLPKHPKNRRQQHNMIRQDTTTKKLCIKQANITVLNTHFI